ncbi:MAG: DoxX family membrane protein, partial [Chloroflexota bacterium]|nr:DoxX family membrane protein [Chloroflexota bacterium]
MKNTKPMRQTDTQRWQPPVRPVEEVRETSGPISKHLPWLVGVPREPGRLPAAIILPVRLFLGITYLYAGIQKFTDPQFFSPTAPGFIGEQMQGYVRAGSPLSPLLTFLVIPHAAAFGALIAFGELLIGISALAGLLTRGGAIAGLALSLIFYLTASWAVHPYFLGGDLPYALLWLTFALAGPGPYSLDDYFFGPILRGRSRTAALPNGPQPRRASSRSPAPSPQPMLSRQPVPSEAMTRAAVLRGFGTAALLAVGAMITGGVAKSRTPNQDFTDASASLSAAGAAPTTAPTTTAHAAVPTAPDGQAPPAAASAP